MDEAHDLYTKVDILNNEARELETETIAHMALGIQYFDLFNEVFNKLTDNQVQADWHFQMSDTARREAKRKRKEAIKLERKARRLSRRRKYNKGEK